MGTDYNDISSEYKTVIEELSLMLYVEEFTILKFVGDVKGKSVLDLACGDGRFARKMMVKGAHRLVGVDISEKMVELARASEIENFLGIEYILGDVKELGTIGTFDIVTAIFLLDYAPTKEALQAMCQTARDNLKSNGTLIAVINSTPIFPAPARDITQKYGYIVKSPSDLYEGAPIEYSFFTTNHFFSVIKYHWNRETYESALRESGFCEITWEAAAVSQAGVEKYGFEYWKDFLNKPSFVCIRCR